jgi:hypothetical protein
MKQRTLSKVEVKYCKNRITAICCNASLKLMSLGFGSTIHGFD